MKTTIVLMLALYWNSMNAQERSFANKALMFGLGYLSGHVSHEMGHQIVANIYNISLDWNFRPPPIFFTWKTKIYDFIPDPIRWDIIIVNPYYLREKGIVAMSGFGAEIISSEIILVSSSLKRDNGEYNYFLIGWISQTVFNPIIYAIYTNNHGGDNDDFKQIARSKHSEQMVKAFIITHAMTNLLRVIIKLRDDEKIQINSTPQSIMIQVNL